MIGDKTLMDALIPFADTFKATGDLEKAVKAAERGAASTKGMKAGLGRASYVDASESETVCDAGAIGLVRLLGRLVEAMSRL
jgi:dihydroxyacetone kinase